MSANNSISARTQRLNKLIECCSDDSNGSQSIQSLNRETLLDAFDVLYSECSKDALRKHDRNIVTFTKKCKYISFICEIFLKLKCQRIILMFGLNKHK